MSDSVFLPNLHYFLAQTDGTYRFPNSAEGDLLKRAKVEVEALQRENAKLREAYEFLLEHGDIASVVICRADYILSNTQKIVMPRSTKP